VTLVLNTVVMLGSHNQNSGTYDDRNRRTGKSSKVIKINSRSFANAFYPLCVTYLSQWFCH
jgi:hypothetical protein